MLGTPRMSFADTTQVMRASWHLFMEEDSKDHRIERSCPKSQLLEAVKLRVAGGGVCVYICERDHISKLLCLILINLYNCKLPAYGGMTHEEYSANSLQQFIDTCEPTSFRLWFA